MGDGHFVIYGHDRASALQPVPTEMTHDTDLNVKSQTRTSATATIPTFNAAHWEAVRSVASASVLMV